MKSLFKIAAVALISFSFAACDGNKGKGSVDSTAVKVDSSITTVDTSARAKADTAKTDTASSTADSTKKM